MRADGFEKSPGSFRLKLRIGGFDAEKKSVAARQLEAIHIKYGMIRHRQAVKREDAKEGKQGGDENSQFESHRNKGRPTVERPAADVDRVVDNSHPVLEIKSPDAPDEATNQDDQRDSGAPKAQGVSQSLNRKWRIGVHPAKSFRKSAPRG